MPVGVSKRKTKRKGKGRVRPQQNILEDDSELEREMEERMMNCGFTNDEAHDLICQGVKPWDDDAQVRHIGS